MRKLMLALGCTAMVVPTLVLPVTAADAQRRYKYREWRDDRGRVRCRKPDGTTGLVVGGVAGALLGRTIDTARSPVARSSAARATAAAAEPAFPLAGKQGASPSGGALFCLKNQTDDSVSIVNAK